MATEFEEAKRRKGPRGQAEVRVTKTAIKVAFPELKKTAEVAPEDADVPVVADDDLMVELNADEDRIYRCHPFGGTHFVKLHAFTRIGEEPDPKTFTIAAHHVKTSGGKEWDEPDREMFTVQLEIVGEGKYQGMLIPYSLDYLVDRATDGTVKFYGGKKRLTALKDFLVLGGYDPANDSLLYEENILPALEDLLLSRGTVFLALIQNGWVQALTPAPIGAFRQPKPKAKRATKAKAK